MARSNPYESPATASVLSGPARPTKTQLWIGYLIAPLVSPVLAASIIFCGGLFFTDSQDAGTPIGIILLPILMLTVGVVISYALALVIGMPIVFSLYRKSVLTGYTIHLAAGIVSLLLAMVLTLVGFFAEGHRTLTEAVLTCSLAFLIIAPFTLLSTTVFWSIARRTREVPLVPSTAREQTRCEEPASGT